MKNTKSNVKTKTISVLAPARLHLGFLDMHGGLERKFGSLGLSISNVETSLTAEYADDIAITGPSSKRAIDYAEQVLSHFGIDGGVKMTIKSAIPEHSGLGSGTQLSLAVATAISKLYDISDHQPRHLAAILHRGARSGIGIGTFMYGGFIVDGGRGENTEVPPVISHMPFPEHWRIVLIFDDEAEGINGVPERRAFNTLSPMSSETAGVLCRLTLMQALPAISENDCDRFGDAITQIQNIVGDYFSQVQGGRYTSPFMNSILEKMAGDGATGLGQSSWGPTGFAIFPNEPMAFQALKKIRKEWRSESRLRFVMSKACNTQAAITVTESKPSNRDEILNVKNL
ncbi:MAG TPA: GHMP kinase [Thiotrichaceae bacterium]|jgi:beta-RFAP synthase|nr:GHMP kinase [Thiotrichaceae bacterium]HIM08136.1 GHMP kinase [Gammaproteobacteria bacterium]